MPLKHSTETFLVILLGAVIVLTGVLLATLPPLMAGLVPMLILLVLTLAYPIALYPLFRSNRADYPFRVLHFFPALMVVAWGVLQLLGWGVPTLGFLARWYTWGWTFVAVLLGMFLLMVFCLQVLRQWTERIATLGILLVIFLALAFASGFRFHWDRSLAGVLWQGSWWNVTGAGTGSSLIALNGSSSSAVSVAGTDDVPNAASVSSLNANEQQWRELLRAFQQQSARSAASGASSAGAPGEAVGSSSSSAAWIALASSALSSSSSLNYVPAAVSSARAAPPPAAPPAVTKKRTPKKHLPQSGPVADALMFLCAAGFLTAVHRKTAARRLAEVVA